MIHHVERTKEEEEELQAMIEGLHQEIRALRLGQDEMFKLLHPEPDADNDDRPLPEDDAIEASHPMESEDPEVHMVYVEALRMVGAKHSKYALVDLVHWLLMRLKKRGGSNEVLPKSLQKQGTKQR